MYKFVYGHPFRNPSAFEQYYSGASNLASGPLRPETANTFEISMERKLGSGLSAIVNLYAYQTHGLIPGGLYRRRPSTVSGIRTTSDRPASNSSCRANRGDAWKPTASIALQRAVNNITGNRLPNSPRQVGKLRMALPVLRDKLTLSSSAQYLGSRDTLAGDSVRPVFLADATATTNRLFDQFDLQVRGSEPVRPRLLRSCRAGRRPHAWRRQIRLRQADLAVAGVEVDRYRSSTRRMIERRRFLGALATLPLFPCFSASGETNRQAVIVVFVSGVEAYQEAVRGLGAGLAKLVPSPFFIDLKSPQRRGGTHRCAGNRVSSGW